MLNAAITRLFDLLLAPFAAANPWLGIGAISLVTAVVALVVFRATSNQRRLRVVKDQLLSHLLEVWLYRDELSVVLRAQWALARDNARYLGHALIPLACMIVPMAVLLVQTDLRYARRPLQVGERTIVAAALRPGTSLDDVSLAAPAGVQVETAALRIPALQEVDWRVRAAAPGVHALRVSAGGEVQGKALVVGEKGQRLADELPGLGLGERLLNPGEPPLPAAGAVQSLRVTYPEAQLGLGRWRFSWIWAWLVLSMAFGYLLRKPLRVQL